MSDTFTAYITKYALTAGVFRINAADVGDRMISQVGAQLLTYYHGDDWHRTPEAAIAKAEAMRVKKIDSLKKSIAKLEKLRFEVPAPAMEKTP